MTDKRQMPRKQSDGLLKEAFEEYFADFLRFIIPDADRKYDLSRGFEFLNTELRAIIPDRERHGGGRVADLLAKVYLKDGEEAYFLVNAEIEGGSDPGFAKRMLQYNYRIWDKHDAPVTSIAFYTGGFKQPKPSEYSREWEGTLHYFRFRAYHILDHSEEELLAMDNPFALVVLACQKGLLEGKVPDGELGRARLMIAKVLIRQGYDRDRTISLLVFLKNFLHVRDPEINRIFDDEVSQFSGGKINMGIIEAVKAQERQMGWELGRQDGWQKGRQDGWQKGRQDGWQKGQQDGWQKGLAKAEEEKIASAQDFKRLGVSVRDIARILGLSVDRVERL